MIAVFDWILPSTVRLKTRCFFIKYPDNLVIKQRSSNNAMISVSKLIVCITVVIFNQFFGVSGYEFLATNFDILINGIITIKGMDFC